MPTGYTADVANGKITEFTEYALQCARNFGALITLRDEPMSSEIPEFKPCRHDDEMLQKYSSELSEFLAMTESQKREAHAADQARRTADSEQWIAETKAVRQRYEAMLQKARRFKSPSPDHDEYAKFIVEQLEQSIDFDCSTSFYEAIAEPIPFETWQKDRIDKLSRMIKYHLEQRQQEIERTEQRNNWVRQLKQALLQETASDPVRQV